MEQKIDLRIQKTYLALHNAFMVLLEEKRFEDLTVGELCDRAMIRRTTFYKHFADKYEYFSFYIKEITSSFRSRLSPDVAEGGVEGYLIHMSSELIRFVKAHDRLVQNIKNSSMFPVLLSILLDQMSLDMTQVIRHAKQGSMSKVQVETTAAFYAGGLTNALFRHLKQGTTIDEDAFIGIISDFLIPARNKGL